MRHLGLGLLVSVVFFTGCGSSDTSDPKCPLPPWTAQITLEDGGVLTAVAIGPGRFVSVRTMGVAIGDGAGVASCRAIGEVELVDDREGAFFFDGDENVTIGYWLTAPATIGAEAIVYGLHGRRYTVTVAEDASVGRYLFGPEIDPEALANDVGCPVVQGGKVVGLVVDRFFWAGWVPVE